MARSRLVCADRVVSAVVGGGGYVRSSMVANRNSGFCSSQFCSGMRFPL